jgi:hypothetical protein
MIETISIHANTRDTTQLGSARSALITLKIKNPQGDLSKSEYFFKSHEPRAQ